MIRQETHPYDFDFTLGFDLQELVVGEGFAVYAGINDEGHWIIEDSGSMADFMDEEAQQNAISMTLYEKVEWETKCLFYKQRAAAQMQQLDDILESKRSLDKDLDKMIADLNKLKKR